MSINTRLELKTTIIHKIFEAGRRSWAQYMGEALVFVWDGSMRGGGPVISILRRFSASVWGAFGLGGLGAGLKFYEV